jgi:hypothetical protein
MVTQEPRSAPLGIYGVPKSLAETWQDFCGANMHVNAMNSRPTVIRLLHIWNICMEVIAANSLKKCKKERIASSEPVHKRLTHRRAARISTCIPVQALISSSDFNRHQHYFHHPHLTKRQGSNSRRARGRNKWPPSKTSKWIRDVFGRRTCRHQWQGAAF